MDAVVDEAFYLTITTSPIIAGATVVLTDMFGHDGVTIGYDSDGEDLSFPVAMTEGIDGAYSTEVMFTSSGVYWARVTVDGVPAPPILIYVRDSNSTHFGSAEVAIVIGAVLESSPASVTIAVADPAGEDAGVDDSGTAIVWPQAMSSVSGNPDCWYFDSVTFSESGSYQAAIVPVSGPGTTISFTIGSVGTVGSLAHFAGFEPDSAIVPDDWVPLSYIRRWTGWSSGLLAAEDLREIRRTAIDTFMAFTNCWVRPWTGTWHGLRTDTSRLFLPMPIVLPSRGGIEPVIEIVERYGDQDLVETIDNDYVVFRVGGVDAKQPFLLAPSNGWTKDYDVRIRATWGTVGQEAAPPSKLRQVIVGLCRWHALSFGKDADDARDQATLGYIIGENNRDMRVQLSESGVSQGLTGDRVVDRALLEMRINPPPEVYGCRR